MKVICHNYDMYYTSPQVTLVNDSSVIDCRIQMELLIVKVCTRSAFLHQPPESLHECQLLERGNCMVTRSLVWKLVSLTILCDGEVGSNLAVLEAHPVLNTHMAAHYAPLQCTPSVRKAHNDKGCSALGCFKGRCGFLQRVAHPSPTWMWSIRTQLIILLLSPTVQCCPMHDRFTDTLSDNCTPLPSKQSGLTPCTGD